MRPFILALVFLSGTCLLYGQTNNEPIIRKSIFFGGGSHYVTVKQTDELEKIIDDIENLELYEVLIHGHTDNIGSLEYNQWLSQMRTDAVRQKLKKLGIEEEFIIEQDFGELSPVYSNDSYNGQLMNRRVDIIFKKLEM